MFRNIVVGVDGSEHSERAIAIACDLAKHYEGRVHIVHSPQVETVGLSVGAAAFEAAPTTKEIMDAGAAVMAKAKSTVEEAGLIAASAMLGSRDPATDILGLVEREGADLIVTGRRGLGKIGGLVLGSTSQKVAHDATCACLTVI